MARKSITFTVADDNRDKAKVFVLTEMPASKAERWALRALSALAASGMEIPYDVASSGLAGVARMGLQAFGGLEWDKAEPLIAEMFECITIIPDPSKPNVTRALIEDDIEEVATRLKLRIEIFKLHVDFFTAVSPSISA